MKEPEKEKDRSLIVFNDRKIRRLWFNDEWHYSVTDIIGILTESKDEMAYWRKLKQREPQLVTICHGLRMPAKDGKMRYTDCVDTRNAFRLIQSIPSKKAEPFKQWLAKIGKERIDEIENPEIAQDRVKEYYEIKGYPQEWINKKLRGMAIRQDLTDEWKNRGIEEQKEFAILTNEISKATFDKTAKEYREFKNITRNSQNLRDSMTDWELILTMIGEKATTDITISRNNEGFEDCRSSAIDGGNIARNTRKEIEEKTGKSLVSRKNYQQIRNNESQPKKRIGKDPEAEK
jgi:hypothetical protein